MHVCEHCDEILYQDQDSQDIKLVRVCYTGSYCWMIQDHALLYYHLNEIWSMHEYEILWNDHLVGTVCTLKSGRHTSEVQNTKTVMDKCHIVWVMMI